MKRLIILFALFYSVSTFAQQTYWTTSPAGYTALSSPAFRFKANTPDSTNNLLIYNPLTGRYNQIYTAVESNNRFIKKTDTGNLVPSFYTIAHRNWTFYGNNVFNGITTNNETSRWFNASVYPTSSAEMTANGWTVYGATGKNTISAQANSGAIIYSTPSSVNGLIKWDRLSTLTKTIQFPDSAGTVALTSNISALTGTYIQNNDLPATTQTANIAINGRSAISDGTVDIWTDYRRKSGASISTLWKYAVARSTDPADSVSGHAFSDMSYVYANVNTSMGYNSYDARVFLVGTGDANHSAVFQDGTTYNRSGTQTYMDGIRLAPTVKGGNVGTRRGVYINNATTSGTGAVDTQIGVYMEDLTAASTANYTLFTKGLAKMHHEGDIELFEATGTTGTGRNINFYAGSATPAASISDVYQSTTQGDLVVKAKNTSGTSLSTLTEVGRFTGGSTPGFSVTGVFSSTGAATIGGNILFSNNLSSSSELIGPSTATSGNSNALIIGSNTGQSTDTDGGPSMQFIPAANGTGATNGGRINLTAYSAETGSTANSFRLFNRGGVNTPTERFRMARDGSIQIGSGFAATSTGMLQIGASTTSLAAIHFNSGAEPSSPTGGDFWYKTAGIFYYDGNIRQVANLNGAQTFSSKTLTSPVINVGSDATGDIYYRNSGGSFTRLGIGSTGNILTISAGLPTWSVPTTVNRSHTVFTPTTGGAVTLVNNQENIISPAGPLASITLALPASPINNDTILITFTQSVTTISYSGGTVVGGLNTIAQGGQYHLTYDTATATWYL